MKAIDLNSLPYKHRSDGASLLISKANRLGELGLPERKGDPRKLRAAVAYYDLALSLLKPFDPNYSTVVNWKCNALQSLGRFEDAVEWYREIVRISDQVDGKSGRNATARLAEQMIRKLVGRGNEPQAPDNGAAAVFDDPPFCMIAEEFCTLLNEEKFKKAHLYLSPALREATPVTKLRAEWKRMTAGKRSEAIAISLEQQMTDWPARKAEDVGWCYFSISSEDFSEAVTVVVSRMPDQSDRITQLEFGRP